MLVADLSGAVVGGSEAPFPRHGGEPDQRRRVLTAAVDAALADAGTTASAVLCVGMGVAAQVSRDGAITPGQEVAPMFDLGLQKEFGDGRGWPLLVENDAKLAALAERWRGVGAGEKNLAVILAGERLGSGIIESGRLLHGASGGAGAMDALALVAGVGNEDGIAKLARLWGSAALKDGHDGGSGPWWDRTPTVPRPGWCLKPQRRATGGRGNPGPDARRMARVLALVSSFFDPRLIVIGGAVAASATALLPVMTAELATYVREPPRHRGVRYGQDAGAHRRRAAGPGLCGGPHAGTGSGAAPAALAAGL